MQIMNRRKFFNLLGSAVIGTIIALKIPDSIAPINLFDEPNGGAETIFDLIDKDFQDAMRIITTEMNKQIFGYQA